jgi:hypothetical protein
VGTPGPRLKSGGDGPLAAAVSALGGSGTPDLVVTNGGSGTVTALPGVGQGFFDDQHPKTLFNLGDALVQAPTFVGASGLGYVVTAGGDLVRFDLNNPAGGASVVFSGEDVLAAQAEASGLVVAALAGGAVDVLAPGGGGLDVVEQLQAQGGVPVLPSALQVVQTDNGHLQVLVSSQGSDTVFVFGQAAASGPGGSPTPVSVAGNQALFTSAGGNITGSLGATVALQASASVAPAQAVSGSTTALIASVVGGTVGGGVSAPVSGTAPSSGSSASSAATAATAATGLSSSSAASSSTAAAVNNAAVLVPVQGNNYATVALLEFGSVHDDEPVGQRMPWLSTRLPLGDTSPLTRFIIGHEEALQQYRGTNGIGLPEGGAIPANDPWNEDLFHLRQPSRPPVGREPGQPMEGDGPEAMLPAPDDRAFVAWSRDRHFGDPLRIPSTAVSRKGGAFEVLTFVAAGMLLAQAPPGRGRRALP